MALITQTDLENRLNRTLTDTESSAFAIINDSAQAYVERMLSTKVEAVSPTTRVFDGGVQHLEIDPCTSITAVKYVDDYNVEINTIDTNEYTTEPTNNTLKTYLRNRAGRFITGINNVAVTAKFSVYEDAEVLAIVKNALLDMVSQVIENKDNIAKESIEGYSVDYSSLKDTTAIKALNTISQGII